VLPGVKVRVQLPEGGILAQVFPVSVTLPSKAVPVKSEVTFEAAVVTEVLLIVKFPGAPFTVNVKGEPVTVSTAVEGATTETVGSSSLVLLPTTDTDAAA